MKLWCFRMIFFMCVSGVNTPMHACGSQKSALGGLPVLLFALLVRDRLFTEAGAYLYC